MKKLEMFLILFSVDYIKEIYVVIKRQVEVN